MRSPLFMSTCSLVLYRETSLCQNRLKTELFSNRKLVSWLNCSFLINECCLKQHPSAVKSIVNMVSVSTCTNLWLLVRCVSLTYEQLATLPNYLCRFGPSHCLRNTQCVAQIKRAYV